MGHVFAEITMSLDGFVTAPNVSSEHPLGEGGMRLHDWLFKGDAEGGNDLDREAAGAMFDGTGAFVIGRRTFDLGEAPWGDDGTFGMPCFVVTHRARPVLVKGPTTFNFVTDGIESAVAQARAAAGDKNVCIMGGAAIIQLALNAGLVDELRLHIVPLLLGAGTRLFENLDTTQIEMQQTQLADSPMAAHARYRILK